MLSLWKLNALRLMNYESAMRLTAEKPNRSQGKIKSKPSIKSMSPDVFPKTIYQNLSQIVSKSLKIEVL
jgi:hypothetical protein